MAKHGFDYLGALKEGYSDEEITPFLLEHHPDFDIQSATQEGYSAQEINQFLSTYKPEKSITAKARRAVTQFGLGLAESAALPYEIAAQSISSPEAQAIPYRENLFDDIERLQEQKQSGQWDEQDQALYENLIGQAKDMSKSEPFIQTADIGIRGLAEKATGLDLQPEGVLEHAANWTGFIKNPKNIAKTGMKGVDLIKSIVPTGSEFLRGVGAGTALEMAHKGDFGPAGTIAATIVGDLMGGGLAGGIKGAKELITKPKQTIADLSAMFTPKDTKELQKQIIKDFRDSGIQADVGTLTNSNLIKGLQTKLSQSMLTGPELDKLRKTMTKEVEDQYKKLADGLGEARYQSLHEAGEVTKESIQKIRESDLAETRKLYQSADNALKEKSFVDSRKLSDSIAKLEKQLKPGAVKSTEQQTVLKTLEKIKQDLFDSEGNLLYANVKDLMNNKIALNDIINYEVQGGAKQLLKGVVAELDRAIISHGKENPTFAKNYINANRRFANHAKTFRNKNVDQLLRSDPAQIMNKMNTIQGMRDIGKVLKSTPNGNEIFKNLQRLKFDQMIGNKMTDNVSEQLKMGTFSNLLKNPKDAQLVKEILGPKSFSQLQKLQKNVGKLADSAQKFFNASKSGATLADMAIVGQLMSDISAILSLNPWPLIKRGGVIIGGRSLSKLFADPSFLKMVEEAILASEKNDIPKMIRIAQRMQDPLTAAGYKSTQQEQQNQ